MTKSVVEVLYTSSRILLRLKGLFQSPASDDRRVALVAFVGDGARAYLPSPHGLHVICNPMAGGTSARVLRELINVGARVQLSSKLHAKVFWSKKRGCIIGSANASTNALGVGGLKEAAVFLPPGMVDIDKLIDLIAPQDITEKALAKLQKETKALPKKFRPASDSPSGNVANHHDFTAWFNSAHRGSDPWKLGWWIYTSSFAESALAKAQAEYGVAKPADYLSFAKANVKQHDWLLCFQVDGQSLKNISWLFVDFVVPVSPSDKNAYDKDYPYQAVQVHSSRHCPSPPFKITPSFRAAFQRALLDWGFKKLWSRKSLSPVPSLLEKMNLLLQQNSTKRHSG